MERQRDQARRRGQVQDGRGPELRRRRHALRRLRAARAERRQGHRPVRGRHPGAAGAGRPERGRGARCHAVLYAESGGQVGDTGLLEADGLRFAVADTLKIQAGVFGHHGVLNRARCRWATACWPRRRRRAAARTVRNHSATHLMHKALRQVLGAHVQQRGSLVDPDKTRFDFAQDAPLTAEQIARVEAIVNAEILANQPTVAQVMPYDDAVKGGAMALFGEKYGDTVRVLDIGFARTLRRHPRVPHRRHRPVQDRVRVAGCWRAPRRSITGDNALAWVQNQNALLTQVAGMLQHAGRSARAHRAGAGSGQGPEKTWSSRAASWPPAPATTWRPAPRSRSRASRSWPPASPTSIPRPCAAWSTTSRIA